MKLKTVKIKNFRGYRHETSTDFGNLTTFVGKNDIGKSTLLEALDIFFNDAKACVKIDKEDVNIYSSADDDNEIIISASFTSLPNTVVIDTTNTTTLESEYLLNDNGYLEVVKKYKNTGKPKTYIRAFHPTNANCSDLLLRTNACLKDIVESNNIECEDKTKNAILRKAIWEYYNASLELQLIEIDVTRGDTKSIWDKLQTYLPIYTLFQSDRKNSDGDNEVQDPLKEAVKEILSDEKIQDTFRCITEEVTQKLSEVSNRTLEKLREMSQDTANTLEPLIPEFSSLKWGDVFKNVSITGDQNIPINKRGSGVKRLILLNFFRAEAERRLEVLNASNVIYAIEEPETSQHSDNQKKLIDAFIDLSNVPNTQIVLTTHSASIVKKLDISHLRLITISGTSKVIECVSKGQLPYTSLNEVNYLAFNEISEEYHNELYGYIEEQGILKVFKQNKPTQPYNRVRGGSKVTEQKILTEYIRHQIHHPENQLNKRYTESELASSIELMRDFIDNKQN
ncbi:ATP-binding protein [Listeria monocytogenes]|nr:ATP-binding protein [Listeria monocytogenes]